MASRQSSRPITFRPQVEAMEDRCLLSASHHLPALPLAAALAKSSNHSAPGSTTYTDMLQAKRTSAGTLGGAAHFTVLSGKATGRLPGDYTAQILYTGTPGQGTNKFVHGSWSLTVRTAHGHSGEVSGVFSGGTVQWDSLGKVGKVSVTFDVTLGSGAYTHSTGSGSFKGKLDGKAGTLSGIVTITLKSPRS